MSNEWGFCFGFGGVGEMVEDGRKRVDMLVISFNFPSFKKLRCFHTDIE